MNIDFYWIDYKDNRKFLRVLDYYHIKDFKQSDYKRPMLLTRNSGVSAHRNGVLYSGETIVSWETLKYLPFFNCSASNIGLSWWSHDVGGFKDGVEDAELYMRYVQFATFSPIFRFSAKRGVYYKREPWRWDYKTYNIVKYYTQLRMKFLPYLYTEAYKYASKGIPLIQPLYYSYPETYDELNLQSEYYFGSELFVCPITAPQDSVMNRSVKKMFLPDGVWYDFKTGKKFTGNRRYIIFYKDEDYPVFARDGSIVCLADLGKNLNVTNPPTSMEIHVFPGKSNSFNLYEDDGYTNLYQQGYYLISRVDYNYMANNYTLIVRPVEGKVGIIPDKRDYRIRFRNTREANDVIVYLDNEKIESNSYVDDTDFVVEVKEVPTNKQLTINCKGKDIEIDAIRLVNDDIDSIISDLQVETVLKEEISRIIFSELTVEKKRVEIRKLQRVGLDKKFVNMFIKLLDYVEQI
jgi:alpha-glucosidase (family GH31 glycosyl hydrolase)